MDFIKITLLAIIMIFVGNIENRISDMASNFGGNGVGSNVLYEFGLGSEAFYQPQALEVFDFSKLFLSQGVLHEPAFAKGFKQADFVGGEGADFFDNIGLLAFGPPSCPLFHANTTFLCGENNKGSRNAYNNADGNGFTIFKEEVLNIQGDIGNHKHTKAYICEESNQLKTPIEEGNSKQAGEEIE